MPEHIREKNNDQVEDLDNLSDDDKKSNYGGSPIAALRRIAAFYRVPISSESQISKDLNLSSPPSLDDLLQSARHFGFKTRHQTDKSADRLWRAPLPFILKLKDGSFSCIIERDAHNREFLLLNPGSGIKKNVPEDKLKRIWSREIILITKRLATSVRDPQIYGFGWFIPPMWRLRRVLAHVIIASLFISAFSLITPLFFQLIVDKVLIHKSIDTLNVLVIGMLVVSISDVSLQYLRTYALSHTASRVDAVLGSQLFGHLLRLPLGYFESRQTGQTVARVRELETVRQFLTGQGVSSAIDTCFATMLVVVLFFYSQKLALLILFTAPMYVILAALIRPILRERTKEKFNRGAKSQQFLVEMIVGIQTIKSAAIESIMRVEWDERLAAYLGASFRVAMTGAVGQAGIQFIVRLSTAVTLYFGAKEVMNGSMTIGELVAFNMIAGQITQPILRLSQLWQDFQQVRISVDRIGDILNATPEPRPHQNLRPLKEINGNIRFQNVGFKYGAETLDVLRDISLDISKGQVIGIIGPSGSGKSTLTKLIQRLYVPSRGKIFIDDRNINEIDPAWLRKKIGVVLQENILFNRTMHENIALAAPGLSRDAVIKSAILAGIHDFVTTLPQGYDTAIEERGANLSGGQRQRIAIARALATDPAILILDEATSALDSESEQIIQTNMKEIVRNRTVIIVSHRLAAVRSCDRILSINDGLIVEDGSHDELLSKENGIYARFWKLQMHIAAGGH